MEEWKKQTSQMSWYQEEQGTSPQGRAVSSLPWMKYLTQSYLLFFHSVSLLPLHWLLSMYHFASTSKRK